MELARKQTMMFYQPAKDRLFLKIVLATPNLVAPCRSERGGGRERAAAQAGSPGRACGRGRGMPACFARRAAAPRPPRLRPSPARPPARPQACLSAASACAG